MKTCELCHLRYPDDSTFCFVDGAPLVPLQDPRVGTTLNGRYVIEDVIGEGGMATVYRARHKLVDRPCAVKIMSAGLSKDQVVRERFRREAKAAQKLAHPNIIEIFDQGDTEDGTAFLVMELLVGGSLADDLAKGAMSVERALPIMIQIARALARAHDFGVIHRDLKPENIFLSRREDGTDLVKLLDFGIARSMQDSRLTGVGEVFGTPQYMAPERITSIDAAAPSDLYAIGIIFYEMLTATLPFDAPDIPSFFIKHMKEPPPPVSRLVPSVPPALEKLILDLMAKDPKARPVDARRVHQDLVATATSLRVAIPKEPEAEAPSSRGPAPTLPPVAIDRWARRTVIFEQMLARAFDGSAPAELSQLLGEVKKLVREVATLRSQSVMQQRQLDALEAKGREGRQRFGFAVDALGVDASKARDEARAAEAAVLPLTKGVAEAKATFDVVQRDVVSWEGRSGFQEPYPQLRDAYANAAAAVERWLATRKAERAAEQHAETKQREVVDLEFQIHELRSALQKMEATVEADHAEAETKVRELDKRSDELEAELLAIATKLCAPLRKRPELGALFHELEADAVKA